MNQTIKIAYLEFNYSEDSFDYHDLIAHILNRPEFEAFTLRDEMANVNEIVALNPQMIIMDLRRPRLPSLELHHMIIKHNVLGRLPLLIITEKGYDSTPLGFEYSRINDYVCYPLFDESTFLSVVQDLLERT